MEANNRVEAAKARAVELLAAGENVPTAADIDSATVEQLMEILSFPWAVHDLSLAKPIFLRLMVLAKGGPLANDIRPLMSVSEESLAAVRGLVDAAFVLPSDTDTGMKEARKFVLFALSKLSAGFATSLDTISMSTSWQESELGVHRR